MTATTATAGRAPSRASATLNDRPGVAIAYQALEDALRREIAEQILRQRQTCTDHPWPGGLPTCSTCGRNGAFMRAARTALGIHREPPAGAGS
ncbi:hypothetical protein [Nonomuraea glycinis]|uniref:hypothetical protein n=1 Tax=Nonomuraea glycinis TaxID=2047744 RepID=UPI0033BA1748